MLSHTETLIHCHNSSLSKQSTSDVCTSTALATNVTRVMIVTTKHLALSLLKPQFKQTLFLKGTLLPIRFNVGIKKQLSTITDRSQQTSTMSDDYVTVSYVTAPSEDVANQLSE